MTAEVAILNKTGVALAADSAVTITNGGAGQRSRSKVYVDANKLFELVKGRPVGVMIYDTAVVSGIPWETVVKAYRTARHQEHFDTLEGYVEDFLAFVEQDIGPKVSNEAFARQMFNLWDGTATEFFREDASVRPKALTKIDARKRFASTIEQLDAQLQTVDVREWATGVDEKDFWRRYGLVLSDFVPEVSPDGAFTLPKTLRAKLARTILTTILRSDALRAPKTGLVVAGFGEDELYPSVYHADVHGFFDSSLMVLNGDTRHITDDQPSLIQPFAQTGEATMFLQGIDPSVSQGITGFWHQWSFDIRKAFLQVVEKEAPKLKDGTLNGISDRVDDLMKLSWSAFSKFMTDEFHQKRLGAIEGSAAFLSKGEIAGLAENLVDLASLRDRVSIDRLETVGGATDVAVISKGDGFIWIKRKHYFDLAFNPSWAMTHGASPIRSSQGSN